jgi:uncharacterized protein YaaQ
VRLVLAVVQSADVDPLLQDFAAMGIFATQIEGDSAVGRTDLAAIVVGVANDLVPNVLALVHANARSRTRTVEPLRPIGERAEFWIPRPVDQVAGGASVFVLPVKRFERIGYA